VTKLKLGPLADQKPVKVSVELPAAVYRDLAVYAEVLGRATGQTRPDPVKSTTRPAQPPRPTPTRSRLSSTPKG
jgi:hypothetical protein